MNTEFHARALERVKRVWRLYILNAAPETLADELYALPEDAVVFGTGHHELYESREAFVAGMMADQVEARDITFEILDEWYALQAITSDVCVVYGTIWVREKGAAGKAVFVEMDSRFTVVCRDTPQGVEICNVHHSIPYLEQGDGEYYPKTLAGLAEEALKRTAALERRVELDSMTELYNRAGAERHIAQAMAEGDGVFFMLDLDNFKAVNDTLGHPQGDRVIQGFADLLRQVFGPDGILGRIGGDEFAVWAGGLDRREAEARFDALSAGCGLLSGRIGAAFCCSAGCAQAGPGGETFAGLYRRADRALYRAKAGGKSQCAWAE